MPSAAMLISIGLAHGPCLGLALYRDINACVRELIWRGPRTSTSGWVTSIAIPCRAKSLAVELAAHLAAISPPSFAWFHIHLREHDVSGDRGSKHQDLVWIPVELRLPRKGVDAESCFALQCKCLDAFGQVYNDRPPCRPIGIHSWVLMQVFG